MNTFGHYTAHIDPMDGDSELQNVRFWLSTDTTDLPRWFKSSYVSCLAGS